MVNPPPLKLAAHQTEFPAFYHRQMHGTSLTERCSTFQIAGFTKAKAKCTTVIEKDHWESQYAAQNLSKTCTVPIRSRIAICGNALSSHASFRTSERTQRRGHSSLVSLLDFALETWSLGSHELASSKLLDGFVIVGKCFRTLWEGQSGNTIL